MGRMSRGPSSLYIGFADAEGSAPDFKSKDSITVKRRRILQTGDNLQQLRADSVSLGHQRLTGSHFRAGDAGGSNTASRVQPAELVLQTGAGGNHSWASYSWCLGGCGGGGGSCSQRRKASSGGSAARGVQGYIYDSAEDDDGDRTSVMSSAVRSLRSALLSLTALSSRLRPARPQLIVVDGQPAQLRSHLKNRKPKRPILRGAIAPAAPAAASSPTGATTLPTAPLAAPKRLRFAFDTHLASGPRGEGDPDEWRGGGDAGGGGGGSKKGHPAADGNADGDGGTSGGSYEGMPLETSLESQPAGGTPASGAGVRAGGGSGSSEASSSLPATPSGGAALPPNGAGAAGGSSTSAASGRTSLRSLRGQVFPCQNSQPAAAGGSEGAAAEAHSVQADGADSATTSTALAAPPVAHSPTSSVGPVASASRPARLLARLMLLGPRESAGGGSVASTGSPGGGGRGLTPQSSGASAASDSSVDQRSRVTSPAGAAAATQVGPPQSPLAAPRPPSNQSVVRKVMFDTEPKPAPSGGAVYRSTPPASRTPSYSAPVGSAAGGAAAAATAVAAEVAAAAGGGGGGRSSVPLALRRGQPPGAQSSLLDAPLIVCEANSWMNSVRPAHPDDDDDEDGGVSMRSNLVEEYRRTCSIAEVRLTRTSGGEGGGGEDEHDGDEDEDEGFMVALGRRPVDRAPPAAASKAAADKAGAGPARRGDVSYADLSSSVRQAVRTVQASSQRKAGGAAPDVAAAQRSQQIHAAPFASALELLLQPPAAARGGTAASSRQSSAASTRSGMVAQRQQHLQQQHLQQQQQQGGLNPGHSRGGESSHSLPTTSPPGSSHAHRGGGSTRSLISTGACSMESRPLDNFPPPAAALDGLTIAARATAEVVVLRACDVSAGRQSDTPRSTGLGGSAATTGERLPLAAEERLSLNTGQQLSLEVAERLYLATEALGATRSLEGSRRRAASTPSPHTPMPSPLPRTGVISTSAAPSLASPVPSLASPAERSVSGSRGGPLSPLGGASSTPPAADERGRGGSKSFADMSAILSQTLAARLEMTNSGAPGRDRDRAVKTNQIRAAPFAAAMGLVQQRQPRHRVSVNGSSFTVMASPGSSHWSGARPVGPAAATAAAREEEEAAAAARASPGGGGATAASGTLQASARVAARATAHRSFLGASLDSLRMSPSAGAGGGPAGFQLPGGVEAVDNTTGAFTAGAARVLGESAINATGAAGGVVPASVFAAAATASGGGGSSLLAPGGGAAATAGRRRGVRRSATESTLMYGSHRADPAVLVRHLYVREGSDGPLLG